LPNRERGPISLKEKNRGKQKRVEAIMTKEKREKRVNNPLNRKKKGEDANQLSQGEKRKDQYSLESAFPSTGGENSFHGKKKKGGR